MQRKVPRIRVFEVGRVFLRDPRRRRRPARGARRAPADAHRRGRLRPGRSTSSGAAPSAAVDFFDVKADLEALVAPLDAALRARARIPALHPGRSAECSIDGQAGGLDRRAAPALAAASTSCRSRRSCSSSMPSALQAVPLPDLRAALAVTRRWCATSPWWSTPRLPAQARSGRHAGRKAADRDAPSACSTFTAARACPAGTKKPCFPGSYARY